MTKVAQSKFMRVMAIVAVLLSNIAVMSYVTPATSVADILFQQFPTAGVNFMLSGPALLYAAGSLIAPVLLKKFNSKYVLIFGALLAAVGGIAGVRIQEIGYMDVMAAITGLGAGIANVVGLSMIARMFTGEKNRAVWLGRYNSAMSIIGAIMMFAYGYLAASYWVNGWNIYYIAIVELVILDGLLFLELVVLALVVEVVCDVVVCHGSPFLLQALRSSLQAHAWCF